MAQRAVQVSRGAFLLGAAAGGLGAFVGARSDLPWARAAGTTPGIRAAASLGPLINIPQTWNNCGPAAIAEVLAYWGISRTQAQVQAVLRVDGPSAGMTPYGVPSFARSVGLRALSGVGGTETLVKELIVAGFPVIVHQVVSLADLVGHWRPIEAYDDRQGLFTVSDPYLGPNHQIGYADFAQMWALRGQAFAVLYPASHQTRLSAVVTASRWNKIAAYTQDLALLKAGRLDAAPAGTPASASEGYRYLGMAWDAAQLGQAAAVRSYLQSAASAGANPTELRWVGAVSG
jgi:hypothetical protein